jgi:hypothetical protein
MSTMTAHILIGNSHIYHEGIIPFHRIYLSENSRPALIFIDDNINWDKPKETFSKVTWIPTIENMLEDVLLMVSVFAVKDKDVLQQISKFIKKGLEYLEMYDDFKENQRQILYSLNKKRINEYKDLKIIFSIFNGSTLRSAIKNIKDYKFDYELCVSG